MPVVNERIMAMVREEIQKRPEVTSQELFEKAKKMDRGMRSLSARQFNATYPLQVRRTLAPRRRRLRGAPVRARTSAGRERLRGVLLEFARAVAGAQDRGTLVDVIGNLDGWVDRIVSGRGAAEPTARRRGRPPRQG
ncbi:MAG TPA: hypothetical protein VK864_04405 [Longimicrobiales bacterium]|nr:hypothetical protein [Longimicrobiales bacterium]